MSLLLIFQTLPPAQIFAAEVSSIDSVRVSPDEIHINMSSPETYDSFLLKSPPRLVVEIQNAHYSGKEKNISGEGRYLKEVRAAQFKDHPTPISRIVFDLKEIVPYRITNQGKSLTVLLGEEKAKASAVSLSLDTAGDPQIAAFPFEGPQNPAAPAPLPTVPVKVNAVKQPHALPRAKKPAFDVDILNQLSRDPISIDFDNTDIRDVLKLLAAKSKINLVYGSDVSGNLTLHLTHVPFDEAFRTVLAMMNLSTMQVGSNILRILTPAALTKSQATAATITKVLTLNYSKASDILTEVNSVNLAQGIKGTTLADAKTNSLIITAPLEAVAATERLVKELDIRPKQVLIEVKLVEVSLNNNLNLGVQWDYQGVNNSNIGGQNGTNLYGTLASPSALNSPTATPFLTNPNLTNGAGATGVTPMPPGGATLTTAVGSVARGLGVNLPASTIFGEMTLGRITSNYFLSATLSAAEAEGKLKVLSDPKIATLNNQAANINVTTQIPYVTTNIMPTAGAQSQTVTYVTTGIQLTVTPTINADGRITLLLNPNVSQPSVTAAGNAATGAPAIDSRIAQTTVLVRDGETIVIGGLIHDSVTDQVAKIPLLGDIPILGWLFKSKSVVRVRNELLIFVTPKVLED